jgi:hypothetical protein
MRLWSLHPRYLDARGLVALWREALLAQAVLRGETRGYRHHPQLHRFRAHRAPLTAMSQYLRAIHREALVRGYAFDSAKIRPVRRSVAVALTVTSGQLDYEWQHLRAKLQRRAPAVWRRWRRTAAPEPHPLFRRRRGGVEGWERR